MIANLPLRSRTSAMNATPETRDAIHDLLSTDAGSLLRVAGGAMRAAEGVVNPAVRDSYMRLKGAEGAAYVAGLITEAEAVRYDSRFWFCIELRQAPRWPTLIEVQSA